MTRKRILIAALAFSAAVILAGVVLHSDAAAAGVAGAFALIGLILCNVTGVCPL